MTTCLPNILVIDADVASVAAINAILNFKDYRVHSAYELAEAIDIALTNPIDLIICDVNIRGSDGSTIVREILALPERNDIPIMFASSCQEPDVIRRRYDFGGAYHVKKPYDSKLLIELVERALWMPALVQTHISRPHFKIGPGTHSIAQDEGAKAKDAKAIVK